jgi:uncharacterized protein (DUF433 family)
VDKSGLYGGKDPREVPMYSFAEAALVLRVPPSTLRNWTVGASYKTARGVRRFEPPMPIARGQRALTFFNLVEAYVLSSIRRDHNVSLQSVRGSVDYVRRELGVDRPLLSQDFYTDGVSLFVKRWGAFVDASKQGQLAMELLLKQSLKRIKRDEAGLAERLYPWRSSVDEPRVIELDPRRSFGRAVVIGTGISIDVLLSRFHAGDAIPRLVKDYDLDARVVSAVVSWDAKRAA